MSDDPANANTGVAWDDLDDRDLLDFVDDQQSVAEIAEVLCRTEAEIRARMAAKGFRFRSADELDRELYSERRPAHDCE